VGQLSGLVTRLVSMLSRQQRRGTLMHADGNANPTICKKLVKYHDQLMNGHCTSNVANKSNSNYIPLGAWEEENQIFEEET
jgi:hypothetical protein